MAVEFNVNAYKNYYGLGNDIKTRAKSAEYVDYSKKLISKRIDDSYMFKKYSKTGFEPQVFKNMLKEIKKPTLLTRLKRVPSVLLNMLKHIR